MRGNAEMVVTLGDMNPGQAGKVARLNGRGGVYKRLLDMGVTPGSPIELKRVAPLGDPIEIKVKGYSLSLRKSEAEMISIALG